MKYAKYDDLKMYTETTSGLLVPHKVNMKVDASRIAFTKCPFALKDEIKAMNGSKFDWDSKTWSVANCDRNWFQIKYLLNQNPYAWFERPLKEFEYRDFEVDGETKTLMPHQAFMANTGLTYHYQLWGAEMGTGKTLSAQMVMEKSGIKDWFWIGPLKSMDNIKIEFRKWGLPEDINVHMTTFERIVKYMRNRKPGDPIPQGLIVDESSRCKEPTTKRTLAIQKLADMIRAEYGMEGFVILMSGTPSPKSPLDWWSQCEIVWPGFLKEGSKKALNLRLAFLDEVKFDDRTVQKRSGWRDDENKCHFCGKYQLVVCEDCAKLKKPDPECRFCVHHDDEEDHRWKKSVNEVEYMYDRLDGLVRILHKKDCIDLPPKQYEADVCEVSPSTMRVARALRAAATSVMQGMTWLREVSDGFLYKDEVKGTKPCNICEDGTVTEWYDPDDPDRGFEDIQFFDNEFVDSLETRQITCRQCNGTKRMPRLVRSAKQTTCPKEAKLINRLKECEEDTGRIVIFTAFQGSNDRVREICHKEGWSVVRCDGRGWEVTTCEGVNLKDRVSVPLEYWMGMSNKKVAFVAHPASGGLSLNLTQSRMAVFYSNDHNPESRSQAEDRVHRIGADLVIPVKIVDIYHLPSDRRIREILKENRRLELMSMGAFAEILD